MKQILEQNLTFVEGGRDNGSFNIREYFHGHEINIAKRWR